MRQPDLFFLAICALVFMLGNASCERGESGGIMAVGKSLMADGLDMSQIKNVTAETFAYAKEQAGEDAVDAVTSKIPGLSNFL